MSVPVQIVEVNDNGIRISHIDTCLFDVQSVTGTFTISHGTYLRAVFDCSPPKRAKLLSFECSDQFVKPCVKSTAPDVDPCIMKVGLGVTTNTGVLSVGLIRLPKFESPLQLRVGEHTTAQPPSETVTRVDDLIASLDTLNDLSGAPDLFHMHTSDDKKLLFSQKWFPETKAAVFRYDVEAGYMSKTVHSFAEMETLRRCLLGRVPTSVEDAGGPECLVAVANAAMYFEHIELCKQLLLLLPLYDLAGQLESLPFSGEIRLAPLITYVLERIGLKLPAGASVANPTLWNIVAEMNYRPPDAAEGADEAGHQPTKRARVTTDN